MRRRDKSVNIERANQLAEQRYLASKGLLGEGGHSHNGMKPFMDVNEDGTFTESGPPQVAQEKDRPRVAPHKAGPPNIAQEKDRPRVAPHKAGPPNIAQEKDRPRIAPKQNPPNVAQEKDRPQPVGEGAITEGMIDPAMVMSMIDVAGDWVSGGGTVNVGGESIPKNLANLIMGLMPAAAATGFIVQFWDEIKSKLGGNDDQIQELSPAAADAAKSRPPVKQHDSRETPKSTSRVATNATRERK